MRTSRARESDSHTNPAGEATLAGRAVPRLWEGHAAWQIALRWWVPPAILAAIAIGELAGFVFAARAIAVVAFLILAYNVALYALVTGGSGPGARGPARARRLDLAQVALDYAAMFALIYLTGGAASPLIFFFVFHVIFAAILFRPPVAWTLAAVVVGGMLALSALAGFGWLHPVPVAYQGVPIGLTGSPAGVAVLLVFFAATVFTTAGTTAAVMERLRRETARAYDAEETLARERSRFVLQVAHNLRAPLAASMSVLEIVRQGYVGAVGDEVRAYLDRIHVRLAAMGGLVDELLALARSREGAAAWAPEPVDLAEIARSVVAAFAVEAERSGVELRLAVPDGAVLVLGDSGLLSQMLENLVSNAVKYTPASGVVDVAVAHLEGFARLEVRDTGIGIPEVDRPRLFEEFFRARNARESAVPGTGLGLALVAEVVDRHGGTIEVESSEGRGSRFVVRIPAAAAQTVR